MKMEEYKNIKYLKINNDQKTNTIIIPGFLQTHKTYENLFDTISKYSNIYVLELPGFGITDSLEYVVNLDYYVILLRDFVKDLNLNNVILFGHSFGGRVISKYESLYNDSLSVILMSSAGIRLKNIKKTFQIIKYKTKKKIYKLLKLKKRYKNLISNSGSKDYQSLDDISKQTFNNIIRENTISYLKRIKTLTLLIWGELDKETPFKLALTTNKLIENSFLIRIKDVGHFPNLEKPVLVNSVLENFYKEVILLV